MRHQFTIEVNVAGPGSYPDDPAEWTLGDIERWLRYAPAEMSELVGYTAVLTAEEQQEAAAADARERAARAGGGRGEDEA